MPTRLQLVSQSLGQLLHLLADLRANAGGGNHPSANLLHLLGFNRGKYGYLSPRPTRATITASSFWKGTNSSSKTGAFPVLIPNGPAIAAGQPP